MKKIFVILALSIFLVACGQKIENHTTPTSTGTTQEENKKVAENTKNTENSEVKIEEITIEKAKIQEPKLTGEIANFETEYFVLKTPKNFEAEIMSKSVNKPAEWENVRYSIDTKHGSYHIDKISPEYVKIVQECSKVSLLDDKAMDTCTEKGFYIDHKAENIIKNEWQNFIVSGRTDTEENTKKNIETIKKWIQFHKTPKSESDITWKTRTETISVIKPQILENRVVLKTQDFDFTLPKEFKDFYFEILENNGYLLVRWQSAGYFSISKMSKKDFENAKMCTEETQNNDTCAGIIFDKESVLGTLKNGDVIIWGHPIETPEENAGKFYEILEKSLRTKTNEPLLQYAKENITIKK